MGSDIVLGLALLYPFLTEPLFPLNTIYSDPPCTIFLCLVLFDDSFGQLPWIFHDHKEVDTEAYEVAQIFIEFIFVINYWSCKKNDKANVPIQKPDELPADDKDDQCKHSIQQRKHPIEKTPNEF